MARHPFAVVTTLLVLLTVAGTANAQRGAGLVLEVSGASTPAVRPYTELLKNATVSLAGGTRLVFVHYHTCRTVTVVGGSVTVQSDRYTVSGESHTEVPTPCPRAVTLKRGGESAGILMRGGRAPSRAEPRLALSTRPAFILIGERAGAVVLVRIAKGGETIVEAPLRDRNFAWPPAAAPLEDGGEYELRLVFDDPAVPPAVLRFLTFARGASSGTPLILLNVE